jgi:hypothetical protein
MAQNPRDGGIAKWLALIVAGVVGLTSTGVAIAEGYPAHPITMVVPFAAGGPTDTLARILRSAHDGQAWTRHRYRECVGCIGKYRRRPCRSLLAGWLYA